MRFISKLTLFMLAVTIAVNGVCVYDVIGKDIKLPAKTAADISQQQDEDIPADTSGDKLEKLQEQGKISFDSSLSSISCDDVTDSSSALNALKAFQSELGISDAEHNFSYVKTTENEYFTTYTMQQYYNSLPVDGYQLGVVVNNANKDVSVNGSYAKISDVDTDMSLDRDEAEDIALDYAVEKYGVDKDELKISENQQTISMLDGETPCVGYKAVVSIKDPEIQLLSLLIDGNSGDVLSSSDLMSYEMITLDSDDPSSNRKKPNGQNGTQTLDVYRASDALYQMGDTNRHLQVYKTERSDFQKGEDCYLVEWNPSSSYPDASAVDALANLQRVFDFYYYNFGRIGVRADSSFTMPILVNVEKYFGSSQIDNAGMAGNSSMVIGKRSNGEPQYSANLDVMGHEFTHGVVFTDSSLIKGSYSYSSQLSVQNAINEGLADIFGELIDDYSDNGVFDNSCDWKNDVRNLAKPSGSQLTKASDFKPGVTDCHDGASIVSYPAYLMANGINGNNDKKISTDTLSKMWYASFSWLNSDTDFAQLRKWVEYAACYQYSQKLLTDKQLESVIDAFDMVGIENSYAYSVTPDAKLTVYGYDKQPNKNYHLNITDQFRSKTFLDTNVNTDKYPLDLQPGIYNVTITDLENEVRRKTFSLIVNDNDKNDKVTDYSKTCIVHTSFGAPERDVALVLDVSGSMDGEPIAQTKLSAQNFITTVMNSNPGTKITLITYAADAATIVRSSADRSELLKAVSDIGTGGGTNMYDGISTAYDILKNSPSKKRILIAMSDGEPNEGKNDNGDYSSPITKLASDIKNDDIMVYSLGFFHNIDGSEKASCRSLMQNIATSGYYYDVTSAESIQFGFEDIASQLEGENKVYIRIACPVAVTVTSNGETLSSNANDFNDRTSFGMLSFDGKDDEVKILRLDQDKDYEVCITGTGYGTMDYSISYPDKNGEYTDERVFKDIQITTDTVISTKTAAAEKTVLNIDSDGDGVFEETLSAAKNSTGEASARKPLIIAAVVCSVLLLALIVVKIIIAVKRYKSNKVCSSCGAMLKKKGKFCNNCGAPANRKRLFLPEKIERKKLNSGAKWLYAIAIVLCVAVSASAILVYRAPATTVYKQLRNGEYTSAQIIYENNVEGHTLSEKYLSLLTSRLKDEADKKVSSGKAQESDADDLLKAIDNMN